MTQKQLLSGCINQDRQSQKRLYNLYSTTLFSSCLKYASNYEDAQDVLQDAFLTIFKKIGQFNNEGSLEGWMRRIVINTALQRYRKQKVYPLIHEEQVEDVAEIEVNENEFSMEILLGFIHKLPDRYRLVFSMYVLDGYSHAEIAEMIQISEGTSKSNLARARMNLQSIIKNGAMSNALTAKSHKNE